MEVRIKKEQINSWAKKQNAHLVGKSYNVHNADERREFVDWFYTLMEEIQKEK